MSKRSDQNLTLDQAAFYGAFLAATRPDKNHNDRHTLNDSVSFRIEFFEDRAVHLDRIEAIAQRNGCGTNALNWLFNLAGKHGLDVTLIPMPLTRDISQEKLIEWYQKNGCTLTTRLDGIPTMVKPLAPQPRQTPMPIGN